MDAATQRLAGLVAVAVGVATHALYFNRYECHMHAVLYLNTFLLTCVGSALALYKGLGVSVGGACAATAYIASCYLLGAYGSLLMYRLFLNPLNRFPGPWPARLSNLYFSFQLGHSDAYYKLQAVHEKYGRFVRIGSNDLSIIDPEAMELTYGNHSKVTKSSWYDNDAPLTSMHTSRSKALHDKRRKVWAPAFSDKALREYEAKIEAVNDRVVQRIGEFKGAPVNVTKWFNLYSFDVMGQLGFGKDYHMVEKGEKHWALELLSEGMQPLALLLPTWLFRASTAVPGLAAGYSKFVQFCVDETSWRVENASEKDKEGSVDIMTSILKAYQGVKQPQKDSMLQADARLIIVAGSDTTAAALTYLFYHLAKDRKQVQKLRDELKPLTRGDWSDKDIRHAQHLNGAINEALRLHPPVPSGVSRLTPKEGMMVGDTCVPGNVTFIMPQYVMGRDESIYQEADSFLPERWYSKPDMIKHKDAFAPFSTGPFGCIGKNLALIELRTLTTRLVLEYDVNFAPGEDGTRLLFNTLDHFTVDLGELDLVFDRV
ncbi:hypothetical protein BAUCODRAFT_150161 [Baudoinia panamericana UAMH 10762]|uniref:Uncharacterized protein n=1 Tax=Baudoinia panamericana (strain UAMH 10762) TaxID=717646 RepID=M2MBQ4_BAUPA|nr:uncharacterized protein BAUCODRAFT_150161 [Baudoinia panamericana UAMH 10762]EMC93926.1 hypothetical protein BAUCODRAFT_150161 [Baudoinia panamericana UAMH 10762]